MRISILCFLFFISTLAFAQDSPVISLFDTLYRQKNITFVLTYHFDSLYKTNNNEIEATISVRNQEGIFIETHPMNITLRGKYRRMKCTMPPLLLNFKKGMLKDMGLSTADEMKLVTHCIAGAEGHKNLAEELLVYQLYESLTPIAYRTIWLNVEYCNQANPDECIKSVGFVLEPDKVITSRLGMEEKKIFNVAEDSIHFESYALTAAFNFLIGNRDWSIVASRNAKLFFEPDLGKYVVIPYDFDYANIVGASYRRETLPESMKHPFDRIYQGEYFTTRDGEILNLFSSFADPILDKVMTASAPLENDRRRQIVKYFDTWFDMIRKEKVENMKYGMVCPYTGGL